MSISPSPDISSSPPPSSPLSWLESDESNSLYGYFSYGSSISLSGFILIVWWAKSKTNRIIASIGTDIRINIY